MKQRSLMDQHLDWLLPIALGQMRDEAALSARDAVPGPTPEDVLRADRAFQAAMNGYFQPAGQASRGSSAAAQRREDP